MRRATQHYEYRYSRWDNVRIHVAGLVLGRGLWQRLAEDLRGIYVKAYLAQRRDDG